MNKYFYDGFLCGLYNHPDPNPYRFNSSEYWDWIHGFYAGAGEFLNRIESEINKF